LNLACLVGEAQFRNRKNVRVQRIPFLLAGDCEATVVVRALTVSEEILDTGSFPRRFFRLPARFHACTVEKRCRKGQGQNPKSLNFNLIAR
jgi:hypothetical protein